MTSITVNGYEAKLDRVEQLPTGPLNYATVQFVFAQSDTAWDGATLTATFSAITPKGARVTLPSPVDNEGIAIIPEKILAVKGSVLTAGLCGTWETNGVTRRITSNMVKVCTLLPGAAGQDLDDGMKDPDNETNVLDYIDKKVLAEAAQRVNGDESIRSDMTPFEIADARIGYLKYPMARVIEEFNTGRPVKFWGEPVIYVIHDDDYSVFVVLGATSSTFEGYVVDDELQTYSKDYELYAVSDKRAAENKIEKIALADGTELMPISKKITLPAFAMFSALAAYCLKAETYSKSETDSAIATAIGSLSKVTIEVVSALPQSGTENTIYFVPKSASANDSYDEFMWINSGWEHIGSTDVDLSNYYTKAEIDEMIGDVDAAVADINAIIGI